MEHLTDNRIEDRAQDGAGPLRARVVIVGSVGGAVEQLTYAVPPVMAAKVAPGHRVLVPLRSRRMTAIVLEVGENLDAGGVRPKPLIELLETRPLFDRAHLDLMDFLASYYMTSLGDAYQSVIPATARVESRRLFHAAGEPNALAAAVFSPLERAIIAALAKRPLALAQLGKLGPRKEVEAALNRLAMQGFIEQRDGTRGRHREDARELIKLVTGGSVEKVRGARQRAILESVAQ